MYQAITEKDRAKIEVFLYNQVLKDSWEEQKEKNGEYLVCYCKIQDINFVSEITADELKTTIKLTIDILEELKNINNTSLNKKRLKKLFTHYIKNDTDIAGYFKVWGEAFRTEKIQHILLEIYKIRKVGGAYATIIAHPQLIHTIIIVYDVLVDSFDDTNLYCTGAYFLLRGIMRIRSRES